jgi:hypothetical protein
MNRGRGKTHRQLVFVSCSEARWRTTPNPEGGPIEAKAAVSAAAADDSIDVFSLDVQASVLAITSVEKSE